MTTEEMINNRRKLIKSIHHKNIQTRINAREKIKAILPILKSLTFGVEISEERYTERLKICAMCPYITLINNEPACGICKCKLKTDNKTIINLVKYEETDGYGCKHPKGSQWKKSGV